MLGFSVHAVKAYATLVCDNYHQTVTPQQQILPVSESQHLYLHFQKQLCELSAKMSGAGYFGCKRDPLNQRNIKKVYDMVPSNLQHPVVDLRKYVIGVYSQSMLNSYTANAVCAAYKMDLKESITPDSERYSVFDPSC